MSLWDTYKQGAQTQVHPAPTPTPAPAAKVGDTLGKHKGLIIALGLGVVAVVVLTRQKPAPAMPKAPEPKGHLRDAGQTWRALV